MHKIVFKSTCVCNKHDSDALYTVAKKMAWNFGGTRAVLKIQLKQSVLRMPTCTQQDLDTPRTSDYFTLESVM